jgi:dynein heavy chain
VEHKLTEYIAMSNKQLVDMIELDRSEIDLMKMITLESLVVIDVHALEVVEKLEKASVENVRDFEWISQLRYYWQEDDCYVDNIQTHFPYGYEYLGNSSRLVITPLTDKCFMTLMGALKLNLGGAPSGPAGTGKTESVKDLAKALAKQCVVFNCQESMDHKFVAKYFKGLASCGAWCCFDEFNRINIEVLSVIAQQLQELFRAKAEGVKEMRFEDTQIKVTQTFCVFITMNPGYAGRTELPDNLKALFRGVAMMVPDYALIGQIKLMSYGFVNARVLAKKMVATFNLASEQLSEQKHYDYGMRAVNSVINAAGLLKRKLANMDESQLLLRALRDVNVPKFLIPDIPLFENIITDLFPGVERPKYEYGGLTDAVDKATESFGLQKGANFIEKVFQLYNTMGVRHGMMIVGPTGGGKTQNYKVLAKAITSLVGTDDTLYKKVIIDIINPKSVTLEQLYGVSRDMNWEEGIIEILVERAINNQYNNEFNWIMFDGPVDAIWIESMNTVLDDNKKLCLSSGKVLMLSNLMKMIFEVEDLEVASPATVSRCGMVYMEPEAMGVRPLMESYIGSWPAILSEKKTFIPKFRTLVDNYFYPTLDHMKINCIEYVPAVLNNLMSSFIKCFDTFAFGWREVKVAEDADAVQMYLEQFIIFSVIWSVCCTVDNEGRKIMDRWIRELMKKHKSTVEIPQEESIYAYKFRPDDNIWELWTEPYKNFEIDNKLVPSDFGTIVVPTEDYARSTWLMKCLLSKKRHTMTPGPVGTGKSINAFRLLSTQLPEDYTSMSITLSAQTSPNQILDTIFSQIDKRKKSVYGPPNGKKCVVFVDDLNMPKPEEWGAQPAIEILRQYLDHKAWYVIKLNKEYTKIEDIIFLTAMGPPGSGRQEISARITRHFNQIAYTDIEDETITKIFNKITSFYLGRFPENFKTAVPDMIAATLNIYNNVKLSLLPTPSKSHYLFTLRDVSRVFQGCCQASAKHCANRIDLCRLWYHENSRVYHDRLTTLDDRRLLLDMLDTVCMDYFQERAEDVKDEKNVERIVFADFLQDRMADRAPYIQCNDLKFLVTKIEEYLEDYNNEMGAKKAMRLVMF